ncbi:MAG: choline monooxygenase [Parasphingorhabdus sp.]|jgi:choline monooxygenase
MPSQISEVLTGDLQLPAPCYTDQNIHYLETEQLYASGWMAIGFASAYAKNNHAWSIQALGKPLLITSDSNNLLHVFHNVCRHRGHVLLDAKESDVRLLSCPYHAWCYALDGRFIKAPFWGRSARTEPDPEQKSRMGLIPVKFEVWYDIIFVNLSGNAEPFDDYIEPLNKRWSEQRPASQLRCFSDREFSLQGNWKLAAENFLDNYHLPWVHPEIGTPGSIEASLGMDVENLLLSDNIMGFSHPTAGADKGKISVSLPPWPGMNDTEQQRQDLFFIFPNTCLVMEGYYLWSMILFPTAVDQCNEKLALYVVGDDAMENRLDTTRQQLSDLIYKVNSQDERVVKNLQKGRQSDAATLGIYTNLHDQLGRWFHQSVARKLLDASQT